MKRLTKDLKSPFKIAEIPPKRAENATKTADSGCRVPGLQLFLPKRIAISKTPARASVAAPMCSAIAWQSLSSSLLKSSAAFSTAKRRPFGAFRASAEARRAAWKLRFRK